MWLCQCTKKRLSNFYSPSFLLLRQPDLPSTATPPPARESNVEILGFACGIFLRKHDVGMSVYQKNMPNFYSPSFLLLRQPDLSSTATPTPARDSTVEILGFVFGIFLENMMWVCQCSKKKCQISIAHHSFPLGSLILHPTLQRHKAEFRAPTPLDAHSTWDFNTYVCI